MHSISHPTVSPLHQYGELAGIPQSLCRGLGIRSVCPGADRQSVCAGGASPDNLRRYEIAEVRRKARNLPRGYLQADLDIVHPPGLPPPDKMLAEAELIKVSLVAQHAVLCCAVLSCDASCHVGWPELCCSALCCAVSRAMPSIKTTPVMITLLPAPSVQY